MRRFLPHFAVALLALAGGCSESNPGGTPGGAGAAKSASALLDEATTAIDAKEWKQALALLDIVIADGRASNDEKVQAWQDKVLCEAQANGDVAAAAALQKLIDSNLPMSADQYAKLGNDLADANQLTAAVGVLEVATKKFGGDAAVRKRLTRLAAGLQQKLQASGNQAELDKLSALGYLGTSSEDDEEDEGKGAPSKDG